MSSNEVLRRLVSVSSLVIAAAVLGCAHGPRAPEGARPSLGVALKQQDDQLVGQRFRTLLDFETDADLIFVATPGRHALTPHTGGGAFESSPGDADSALQVKVDSLLFGTKLPGKWTLLGAYAKPRSDTVLTTMLLADGEVVAQNQRRAFAGTWVFAAVELTVPELEKRIAGAQSLRLAIESDGRPITIDDVLLVDNTKAAVEAPADAAAGWKIERRGFTTHIDAPGRFNAAYVSTSGSLDGYGVEETTSVRARLIYRRQVWTLFPDGRLIKDGKVELLGGAQAAAELIAAHNTPADVKVDDTTGRLDQSTDGDAENDGYNEVRGAYQVVAKTPRLSLQIVPRGAAVVSPVLEIKGLPAGKASAMMEGRLIESTARLPDGTALVLLPLKIERPTTVTVKVE